jgi:glycosyltransferase involved in cell wall biosynthesis
MIAWSVSALQQSKMNITLLSIAYPLTRVGEDAVGGSEQVLASLDRALTEAGHRSLVIAEEGSRIAGTLIPSPPARGKIDESERRWARKVHSELIKQTLASYAVDMIHFHSLDFHQYLPEGATPILATLHLPPDWYPRHIFNLDRKNLYLNCVSLSQHSSCPKSSRMLPPVRNGVDVKRLNGSMGKQEYALALGRICPEKGFHLAVQASKKADSDLLLAGEVIPFAPHQEYFRKKLSPLLDRRRRFIGPVGFERKRRLLGEARCLLITSSVEETSSLVAMEALAAGTPVIAYRRGALPEIVEHGRTGYLVSSIGEMAEAIRAVVDIDIEYCKAAARRNFSAQRMVDRYTQIYHRLVEKHSSGRRVEKAARGASWLVNW